ncbi:MAG: hypothetical protein ABEK59_08835 [Halobacteria archaeon]
MDRREILTVVFIILGAALIVAPVFTQMSSGNNVRISAAEINESHPSSNVIKKYPEDIYRGIRRYDTLEPQLDRINSSLNATVRQAIDDGSSQMVIDNQEGTVATRLLSPFNVTKDDGIYKFSFSAERLNKDVQRRPQRERSEPLMIKLTVNATKMADFQKDGGQYRIKPGIFQNHKFILYNGSFYKVENRTNSTLMEKVEWSDVLKGISRDTDKMDEGKRKLVEGTAEAGGTVVAERNEVMDFTSKPVIEYDGEFFFMGMSTAPRAIRLNTPTLLFWIAALLSILYGLYNAHEVYREKN